MRVNAQDQVPYVSVVIPAYNAEKYLESTVNTVLRQTWSNYEILIVDDCSTDETAVLAKRLAAKDSRIVYKKNSINKGVSETRNYAVEQARGEWIAFLDSDDQWREDKLEKQLALIEAHPEAVLTYTGSAFMDQDGKKYGYVMPVETKATYKTLLRKNILSCSSVMVKRAVMLQHPMGSPQTHEDYGAWLRILRETPAAYGVNEPLLIYRIAKGSKSSNRIKSARMYYRTCIDVGYGPMVSGFLTFRYTFYSVIKRRNIYKGK